MAFDSELSKNLHKLDRKFYLRPVLTVAKNLLGKAFIKIEGKEILAGMITEVEAYDQKLDQAAHSFRGKSKRNEHMFYEGGFSYVYFIYGVHHCLNIVTGKKDYGAAVLIRSMQPLSGISTFSLRRFGKSEITEKEFVNLLNGPGKICQAFNLTTKHSGKDLLNDDMFILDYKKISKKLIGCSERIGISKATDLKWRFYISDSKFLSK